MAPTKKKKPDTPADPDSLVRQSAGTYTSGDGRFEVRQSDKSWFLIDSQQTDELGQPLLHGPFASMKAAREAIPDARNVEPAERKPARAHRERGGKAGKGA